MRSNKEFLLTVYEKAEKGKAKRASRRYALTAVTSLLLAVCMLAGTAVYFKNELTPDADTPVINGVDNPTLGTEKPTAGIVPPEIYDDSLKIDGVEVSSGSITQNLLDGLQSENVKVSYALEHLFDGSSDFAFDMLAKTYEGENVFISPYSIIAALAMTANGADGETRAEIESAVGLTVDEMNELIMSYNHRCEYLNSANSFWMRNGSFTVKPDFLINLDAYYDAGVFAAPFDDGTLDDINKWVSDNTDGMIPEALTEIPKDVVAYIINTLLFAGKWEDPYYDGKNTTMTFTSSDGTEAEGEFMHGESALLELDYATGICKDYSRELSFVALLPNEGCTIEDVISSLDSDSIAEAMKTGRKTRHSRCAAESLPKFKSETSLELSDALKETGIISAFDLRADFSRITDSIELFVSQVIHKTAFEIDEEGSRAAAATIVEFTEESEEEFIHEPEKVPVIFDRPFVYMIVNSYGFPIFIGVCDSIK